MSQSRPSVLFVCGHNVGRSEMAAAYLSHLTGGRLEVRSAGAAPADAVNPAVVEAMNEVGIDLSAERPKILTTEAVQATATGANVARRRFRCAVPAGLAVSTRAADPTSDVGLLRLTRASSG